MDDKLRGILNTLGLRIDPATDSVLQSVRDNIILNSPTHVAPVSASNVETSHSLTAGKKHIYIKNYGDKPVFWGGSGVTVNNGQELRPKQGWFFPNCASGFTVYFICNGTDTTNIRTTEFADGS